MKRIFLIITIITFYSLDLMACSCLHSWNDSFSLTAEDSEFLALVKIVSFDEYIEGEIMENGEKVPYSMTAEIIKKYKGKENRKQIKIFGDNGILCRPYLTDFEINTYYLISPNPFDNSANTDYDFFACRTEYLKVDMETNTAYGNYSLTRNQINLDTFENKLENGDWDLLLIAGSIVGLLTLTLTIARKIQ